MNGFTLRLQLNSNTRLRSYSSNDPILLHLYENPTILWKLFIKYSLPRNIAHPIEARLYVFSWSMIELITCPLNTVRYIFLLLLPVCYFFCIQAMYRLLYKLALIYAYIFYLHWKCPGLTSLQIKQEIFSPPNKKNFLRDLSIYFIRF